MRAVFTIAHGERNVLQYREDAADPVAGAGEVVVSVAATAVNYHDIFTRRGMPGVRIQLPVIVGSDLAGVVHTVGHGVEPTWHAQRVLIDPLFREPGRIGMVGETRDGGRAERVAVPASMLVRVPQDVDLDHAAALPLAYGTAHRMLVSRGRICAGETVLILGASGGVGVACVQLAKLAGARVIACGSNADKLTRLRQLGADDVINYNETDLVPAVHALVGKPRVSGNGGVDVAVNFTGGDTLLPTQKCVKLGGRILCCGATAGFDLQLDARYWWTFEQALIGSNGWAREDLHALLDLVASKRLVPAIDRTLPLEHSAEAERLMEERLVVGKILIKP